MVRRASSGLLKQNSIIFSQAEVPAVIACLRMSLPSIYIYIVLVDAMYITFVLTMCTFLVPQSEVRMWRGGVELVDFPQHRFAGEGMDHRGRVVALGSSRRGVISCRFCAGRRL